MKMDKYLLTLLFGVLMLGGCSARVVTVSPGPLIRVQGQPVSIRCDVKEYTGPREQDFDWMMQREGGPVIQVISTFDTRFSHSSLSSRVAAGDISVARLGDNVVDLRIEEVRPSDSGVYTCKTPSTDSVISGNYDATVQLTVIPDTLKVSPQPATPVVPEGSDITLSCNVTRQLTHPTYLSVTWALRKGASQLEEFLTFGPQGGVATATKYAQRYADGGVRLVPGENGVFGLVVSRATVADEGMYVCIGREWTHEDGGTWKNIVEKRGEMGTVTVTPTGQSLSVTASSPSSSSSSSSLLSPGDTLNLLCSVAATNLPSLALEVTWSADGNDIISVDRSGVVVSNMSTQGGRGVGGGEVGLERTGTGEFRLLVRGVGGEDGGVYTCRVRAFIEKGGRKGGAGRWYMAAEKTSNPVTVKVSEIKPSFSLTLDPVRNPQMTAEPTELACHVTNITHLPLGGRLGVAWEHTTLPGIGDDPQTSHPIGSLDGHGNLLTGAMYSDRLDSGVMSLTRVQPNTFKLRFLQTQEVDMGEYVCTVSAWSVNRQGDMVKTVEYQSSPLTVRWEPKRPSLSVVAKRIREASVGGATFEMSCAVASENLGEAGYSVLIQSQESLEGTVRTIMTLSPDNVLQHGGATDPSRRDSLVLTKSGPAEFRFRLAGVQLSDRGYYWCDITAWTKQQPRQTWTRATSAESNKVRIDFEENGPSFSIAIQSDSSSVYPWETAKMECSLSVSGSSPKTDDLAYEVRWFFTRLRGGDTVTQVASIDRFGVVRKDARNSSSDISVERRDTHTYLLNVHGTQDSDSGEYHCTATPWYLSASTGAWTQAGELTSARVFLTVRFAVWDSLKLPLLYGASASLGVGLFSLVLGLVCAQCCCRNTTHTPRSRNKLMDLEMD